LLLLSLCQQLSLKPCRLRVIEFTAVWLFQWLMGAVSTGIVTRVGCVGANTFWLIATEKGPSTGHVVA
jgi:hypothetical protein